jgi:hypothetical protein
LPHRDGSWPATRNDNVGSKFNKLACQHRQARCIAKLPNALLHSLGIQMVRSSYFQAPLRFSIAGRLLARQQRTVCLQCILFAFSRSMGGLYFMGRGRSTFTGARRNTSIEY